MADPSELTVGIGAGAAYLGPSRPDVTLPLGPAHPSAHGLLRVALTLDGDRIATADPIVGYLHRGAEKLFEVRDYRQIMVLANRHDWLSAFASELGVALAVETTMGLDVPERAVWLRTLLAELNRVLSHLMFLGAVPGGDPTAAGSVVAYRHQVQDLMEEAAGGRIHFMIACIGGLKADVPPGWTERLRRVVHDLRAHLPGELDGIEPELGVLTRTEAIGYGASGPVARASGLDLDLRRDDPYLAYPELADPLRVVTRTAGDAAARFACLLEQVGVSLDLVEACLDRLGDIGGPVNVRLPKTVRAPEGHSYTWTESPLGISGYYLVSRGEKAPWRLKVRSASFNNVQALAAVLPGSRVADLTTILASMFFIVGDIDR